MANSTVSQIKIGETTYDLADIAARDSIAQINNQLSVINNRLSQINFSRTAGLCFSRVAIPNYTVTVANATQSGGYSITWSLARKPNIGIMGIHAVVEFGTVDGGTWIRQQPSIQNRASSSASWGNWDYIARETYKNATQRLLIDNTPTPFTSLSTGQQQRIGYYHNNEKGNSRSCSGSGNVWMIWTNTYPNTGNFTESGSTNKTITFT